MTISISRLILLSLFVLIFINCADDDMPEPMDPMANCCAESAVVYEIGNGSIYVPNAFTPNNDGINDLFSLQATNIRDTTINLSILDNENNIIFFGNNFNFISNPPIWDGQNDTGGVVSGVYRYQVVLRSNGLAVDVFEGSVCSADCRTDIIPPLYRDNCRFPVQYDGQGGVDENLPNLDPDCFN